MLRAGLVGLGMMGRHHARVLDSLDGVEFAAIFDPAPGLPEAIEGAVVHSELERFLDEGLDYAVVAAPTVHHLSLGTSLAERGIHALIEKPVASDAVAARELCRLFDDAGLVGGVGHIERFNPALQAMRERLEHGAIGDIYQIVTRRQGPFPGRIADVGVVKDLATHDIDLTGWVSRQDYLTVNARTSHRSGREHEDMLIAVATLTGGIIASHTVNWLSPFKERVTIVTGEKGALVADTLTADLTFHENGKVTSTWDAASAFRGVSEGDSTRFALARKEPLLAEHEAFRDAVTTRDTSGIVSLVEGTRAVEIAEQLVADGRDHHIDRQEKE